MPLPQTQLDRLHVDLHNHDKALADLQASPYHQQPVYEHRIHFHETILRIGRDPHMLSMLAELYAQPDLAQDLARHPNTFLQARKVQLPTGATKVLAIQPTPQTVVVAIHFHLPDFDFCLEWSSQSGFAIRQLSPEA